MPSSSPANRGYAFLILMMMVTILLISLTAALPSIYTAGQREKEEELIFRGNEYSRAIIFFHRQFGRYPTSIDEILKKTNGFRFLRRPYPDPMTAKGQWRLIHANAAGVVIDSRTISSAGSAGNTNPQGLQSSQNPPNTQGSQNPPNTANSQNVLDLNNSQNPPDSQSTQTSDSSSSDNKEGNSSFFTNQVHGAFIVGVASSSTKPSIRIYNNRTRYDEWEFLAIEQGSNSIIVPGGGGAPGQPTTPTAPTTPTTGPGQNPGQTPGSGLNGGGAGAPPPTDQPNPPE